MCRVNPMRLDYAPPPRRSPWRRVLLLTLPVAVVVGLLVHRAKRILPAPAPPPPPPTVPMYRVVGTSKDGVTVSIWVEDHRGDAANARKHAALFIASRTAAQMPPKLVLGPKTPRWPEWIVTTRPAATK